MKQLIWVGSSRRDLREFPDEVRQVMGYALYLAQIGERHPDAKLLRGPEFGGIIEVVDDHDGDTYRAVYTVRFAGFIYVLHCFKKKSKRGIATPKPDLDLIRVRLQRAEEDYDRRREKTS